MNNIITTEYLKIIEKLKYSYIFGETIDINNNEMIIVGAYFLGKHDADIFNQIIKEHEINVLLGKQ